MSVHIREVWSHNLETEFNYIKYFVVGKYNNIAMDTEFPGVALNPVGETWSDFSYDKMNINVNALKLIQLGLTFTDEAGNLPTINNDVNCIWQFNFREFDITKDPHAEDSIAMLKETGIDFDNFKNYGVAATDFGYLLMGSGILMNKNIKWVVFQGGHDFGYFLKLITGKVLPEKRYEFYESLKVYFPKVYDLKYLMESYCDGFNGGLKKAAYILRVERVGVAHQAGSDSLLTSRVFKKFQETFQQFFVEQEKHQGQIAWYKF